MSRPIDAYVVSGAMFLKEGTTIFANVDADDLEEPMRSLYIRAKRYWKQNTDPDWGMFVKTEFNSEDGDAISEAWDSMPTGSADEVIRRLRLENYRKKAAEIGTELITARDQDTLDDLTSQLVKASQSSRKTKAYTNEELYMRFLLRQDTKPEYTSTGFSTLDRMTFIEQGDFIVVAGRPSTGKTAFTLQMMLNMAKQGKKCVYFSLETNVDKLYDRIVSCYMQLNYDHVKMRKLTPEEEQRNLDMAEDLLALPFQVVHAAGMNAETIEHEAVSMGADVIFVDYIGIVTGKKKSRYEQVTDTSIALHSLAQRYGITVVALSQLRRDQGVKLGMPRMDDLRESGQIEADADLIILLFNEAKDVIRKIPDNETVTSDIALKRQQLRSNPYRLFWALVVKNKEGVTGDIEFNFFGDRQSFSELETGREE